MFNEFIFRPIFNLMLFLYNLVGDFGLAVLLFAIIIKSLLYPFLKSQLIQAKKMRDLKPELKKIKKKAKGDKQLEYLMTMNLYKQNGVKMSKSFVVALIQLPIFIAMFQVIRFSISNLEVISKQAYSFIKTLPRIAEVINNPDIFKPTFFGIIDLSKVPFSFDKSLQGVLAIIILLAAAYVQRMAMKSYSMTNTDDKRKLKDVLNEAADGREPDQSEVNDIMMNKMNNIMPIMLLFSFGFVFCGLSFYSLITGSITLLQRKIIMSKLEDTKIQQINQKEVDERLKKAKEAQIIFENRKKQFKNKKKTTKKPVKKRSNKLIKGLEKRKNG